MYIKSHKTFKYKNLVDREKILFLLTYIFILYSHIRSIGTLFNVINFVYSEELLHRDYVQSKNEETNFHHLNEFLDTSISSTNNEINKSC